MRFILLFSLFLIVKSALASEAFVIKDSSSYQGLNANVWHFEDRSNQMPLEEVQDQTWERLSGVPNFGSNRHVQWLRYEIYNALPYAVERVFFVPYHHIHNIEVYEEVNNKTELVKKMGTKINIQDKEYKTEGYPFKTTFNPNETYTFYFKYTHINRPLRASVFLLTEQQFLKINSRNSSLLWLWRGVLLFTIITSFILYWYMRLKMFIYYFLLNLGVSLFIGSQVGDYFLFFDIDPNDFVSQLDFTGATLVNIFFPLFLSSLTPVKQRNPLLWRVVTIVVAGIILIWFINLFPGVRQTNVLYYSHFYIMISSGLLFVLQPILLLKSLFYKDKNALPLFIIYSMYIFAVFSDVILPNMGVVADSPHIHISLIASSLIEIFSFMFIMGGETVAVYKDRDVLQVQQQKHQNDMVVSMVKGQEEERNRVGRELHDLIGANMAIIKQRVDKSDKEFYTIVKQTIESVRTLSHGLITPMVKNDEFVDEIKEMGYLFSTDIMEVHIFFLDWFQIDEAEITTHLYRITQELLQNATKHSKAKNVYFQFIGDTNKNLTIMYEDDGIGFNSETCKNGLGIRNIRNRVSLLQGSFNIDSMERGSGTTILIDVPCI